MAEQEENRMMTTTTMEVYSLFFLFALRVRVRVRVRVQVENSLPFHASTFMLSHPPTGRRGGRKENAKLDFAYPVH